MSVKKNLAMVIALIMVFSFVFVFQTSPVGAATKPCTHKYTVKTLTSYDKKRLYTCKEWTKLPGSYHENYGKSKVNYGTVKVKSVKNEYSVGGGVSIPFGSLFKASASAQYKKTVQTISGRSIGFSLGAHQYGQVYTGKFYDVFSVKKTVTKKCTVCGKQLSKTSTTSKVNVPLKQYDNEVTPTKVYKKNMVKKKDKKGQVYWTPNQCFNNKEYESIY